MEEKLLLDQSFDKIVFLFTMLGLNLRNEKSSIKQSILFFINLALLNFDITCATIYCIDGIRNRISFTEITFVATCMIMSLLGNAKSVFYYYMDKKVQIAIENLRELERRRNEFEIVDQNLVIDPEIKKLNFSLKFFNTVNVLVVIGYDLTPFVMMAWHYFDHGEFKLLLSYRDIYPYDAFDKRYFLLTLINQLWSVFIVLLQVAAVDTLFYICTTHIKIHFKVLKRELERVIPDKPLAESGEDETEYREKLSKLIIWHQEIIHSANMMETVYSMSTLFNFCIVSVVICMAGFNTMSGEDLACKISSVFTLIWSVDEIFFMCSFGDSMSKASMEVADGIYNSRWYLTSPATRKDMLQILIRAQNPCKVTAAGFAEVNFRAFSKILSTSWSYLALLRTMYSQNG